jgi:hypothetical protein
VSSSEKVLVSAGTDMSGDINEGKAVSEWILMGSSVTEVLDFLECFCRDQDMKVFFKGRGIGGGSSMMLD